MTKVGLVGLGVIGQLYGINLLKGFKSLAVYDVDMGRAEALKDRGAVVKATAKEVAGASEVVVLALPSPEAVESAVTGNDGVLDGAHSGLIILDLSTIDPETCRRMYDAAKRKGASYLEAPVSGGKPLGPGTEGAKSASVTFMVGGDKTDFERAKPVMQVLGQELFYLGPPGTGSTVKLLSNLVSGLINLVSAEAFAIGAAAGIDAETLLRVFDETDADSYFLQEYIAPRVRRKDFEPGFSVDLMYKDHRLAEELASKLRVPAPLNGLALQIYQMMRAQGLGQKDLAEAVNFWAKLSDMDIYNPRKGP